MEPWEINCFLKIKVINNLAALMLKNDWTEMNIFSVIIKVRKDFKYSKSKEKSYAVQ